MSRREGSALEDFFGDFVPKLHSAVRGDHAIFAEDPTIDLDRMEVAVIQQPATHHPPINKQLHQTQPSQQQLRQQPKQRSSLPARPALQRQSTANLQQVKKVTNQTFQVPEKRDCSMDELNVIVDQLKNENSYSQKLLAIMLDGLERTLSPNYYRFFIEYGLPSNWIPLVKMNNDNTPFVEFLVKSDLSDQDPFSQLKEYSADQMALCAFVLNHLQKSARKKQLVPANNNNNYKSNQAQQQQAPQRQPQQRPPQPLQIKASKHGHSIARPEYAPQPPKKQVLSDKNQRSSLPIMTTSTPKKSQADAMAKRSQLLMPPRHSVDPTLLNDSKRILPPRACKANTSSGSYKC